MNRNPKKSQKKKPLKIPKEDKSLKPKTTPIKQKSKLVSNNNVDLSTIANNIISNSRKIPKCNKDEQEYLKNLDIDKKNPGSVTFTKKKIPIYRTM